MKKQIAKLGYLVLVAALLISVFSGYAASHDASPYSSNPAELAISSFYDIPGITTEEIAAIEAFQNAGRHFSYASLLTTEMYQQPDGSYAGFTPLFCELLSELFDIPFDFSMPGWEELINGLNNYDYDFTGELTPTPERALIYLMTRPIVERGLAVFTLASSPRIETEADISNLTIAFLEDTITAQSIIEGYPTLSFNIVEVSEIQDAAQMLLTGEIDAFIDEAPAAVVFAGSNFSRSRDLFSYIYTPIALVSANPELEPIISVIDKYILAGGINKIHELYIAGNKAYNEYAFKLSLTSEETAYLNRLEEQNAKVPIALEHEVYPISFYNAQEKEYQGIAVDVLKEVSKISGIEFDVLTDENSSWAETYDMLVSGAVTLVPELLYTKERAENFLFSEYPYAVCRYSLISKLEYPNLETYQVSSARVGLIANTGHAEVFESYFPNHPKVTYYNYQADAQDALENGEIDLFMASEHQLLEFVNYREKPGYKNNRIMSMPLHESYFGFNKNETVLHSIINKAMHSIDVLTLEKAWVNRSFDYGKALATEREQEANKMLSIIGGFAIALTVACGTLLFFIIRNINHRKVIENQTAVINAIYHSFPDLVFTKDLNGRYTSTNQSFLDFSGSEQANILGKTCHEIYADDPHVGELSLAAEEEALRENIVVKTEIWRENKDGVPRLFDGIIAPLVNNRKTIGLLGFMRDITEQRELLEKIQYMSQYELVKYTLTGNALNIVHFDMELSPNTPVDAQSPIIWSDEFRAMLGLTHTDIFPNFIGSLTNRIIEEDKENVITAFRSHVNDPTGKSMCDVECRIMIGNGSYRYFRIVIGTLRDEKGIALRMAGAIEDIHERTLMQQDLNEANRVNATSLNTLKSILDGLDGMIYVTVPDTGEILFINDHMQKHFNLTDDCIGQICYKVLQKDQDVRCEYCPCFQLDHEPNSSITWNEKNTVTDRSYRNTDRYIQWPDGRTVHLQYSVDMTDLIAAKEFAEEQRLFVIEEHKKLQMILDMLPVGIRIMRTGDGVLLYANEATLKMFGGNSFAEQGEGQPIEKFLPEFQPDGRRSTEVLYELVKESNLSVEIQCVKLNGEPLIARFTTCRINYQGERCSLGIVEDVTAEKAYQQRLHDIAQKEHEANQAKSEFLAKMSHEIRTPMNAIIGMSELALRETMSETAYEQIITVKQAGAHLLAIINDILDFSKIETGKLELILAEYSFSSLANDVISIIRMRLFDSQVRFAVNIDGNIPDSLIGDVTRIRQILINIMGNAVKYTDKGFVYLDIYGSQIADDNTITLTMEVKDTGRGIKEEDLERLFSEYIQLDLEKNQGIEGIGLGLAISRNLVKTMGGQIAVDSEYGVGSTFTITIPQKVNKPDKTAAVENPLEKGVILYERRRIFSDSISKTLENLGVPFVTTTNGTELCQRMEQEFFPFVFVPYPLFSVNKDEILQAAGLSRIVLLASFGDSIPEGNWAVLTMPVHAISITNVLNGTAGDCLFSGKSESNVLFAAPDAKILVVDDIETNLKVVEGLLKPYEMTVDLCKNGADAIRAVMENDYDLVFMDHRMPDMDGVEATGHIRDLGENDPRFKTLPIVALTANAVSGMREVFLESGFDDFLSKPIETSKLHNVLEKWIKPKYGKRKTTITQVLETAQEANSGKDNLTTNLAIPGIDIEKGLLHSGGKMELLLEILNVFCDDGRERIQMIHDCLEKGDIITYTIHVHALKSASANIGAMKLSDAAKNLENAGNRQDMDYIYDNNGAFLTDMQKLISNISIALPSSKPNNQEASAEFIIELQNLKIALENMDARAIKTIMDGLKKDTYDDFAEELKNISRNILLSEYDEAMKLIEAIIQK